MTTRLIKNLLKYTIDVEDEEETKYLVKRFSPEYVDQDDVETVYHALDEITTRGRQERQTRLPNGEVIIASDSTVVVIRRC